MANQTITGTVPLTVVTLGDLRLLSYLPADPKPVTVFPKPAGRDFKFQVRMIVNKWKRFYPLLTYYPLRASPNAQPALPGDYNTPQGRSDAGGTLIDPLYGEPIPLGSAVSTKIDPHTTTTLFGGGAMPKKFHTPVQLNLAIRQQARTDELRQWGFDRVLGAIAIIPFALLDAAGVTVKIGDEFDWGADERLEVLQLPKAGYWKNSKSRFFMVMNCQTVTVEA